LHLPPRCRQKANAISATTSVDRPDCNFINSLAEASAVVQRIGNPAFKSMVDTLAASLMETDNHLQDAMECEYITPAEHQRLSLLAHRALGATTSLQSYLLRTPDGRRSKGGR
jgi:hypothetical protein